MTSDQPPRPAGIPAHYIFDNHVELWMPPSAIKKAASAEQRTVLSSSTAPTITDGITVVRSSAINPTPYTGKANDPICFEYTNTGQCSRLARGEICRYRHLEASHPDVIADKVRQGKLPLAALMGKSETHALQVRLTQ